MARKVPVQIQSDGNVQVAQSSSDDSKVINRLVRKRQTGNMAVSPDAKLQPTSMEEEEAQWHFLDHGSGAPVRCSGPGKIECASDDGTNCKWGTYGSHSGYAVMSGVTALQPLSINCPGWASKDGSNACEKLSCEASHYLQVGDDSSMCRGSGWNSIVGWPKHKGRQSTDDCRALCSEDVACTAFDVARKDSSGKYDCWLFGHQQIEAANALSDERCFKKISGHAASATIGHIGGTQLSLSKFPQCKGECVSNGQCKAVRWVVGQGSCELLSSIGATNSDSRWMHQLRADLQDGFTSMGVGQCRNSDGVSPIHVTYSGASASECKMYAEAQSSVVQAYEVRDTSSGHSQSCQLFMSNNCGDCSSHDFTAGGSISTSFSGPSYPNNRFDVTMANGDVGHECFTQTTTTATATGATNNDF